MIEKELTFADTWANRTEALNGMEYSDYLKSPEWLSILKRYRYDKRYSKCEHCQSKKNVKLHHKTYKYIRTKDACFCLTPMCLDCIKEVHHYAKEKDFSIIKAKKKIHELHRKNALQLNLF